VFFVVHVTLAHRWKKLSICLWRYPKTSKRKKTFVG
jgi:hypothetical protein